MKVVFNVTECTFLRYFVPLAVELNSRSHDVIFAFDNTRQKHNAPCKNWEQLTQDLQPYTFIKQEVYGNEQDSAQLSAALDANVEVVVEGISANLGKHTLSLTYMTDFVNSLSKYIDSVDHVVIPSTYFAEKFNFDIKDPKFKFLGSPKFDNLEVYTEENVPGSYDALLLYHPKAKTSVINKGNDLLKENKTVVVKTRGKHPISATEFDLNLGGNLKVIGDQSWYPHATMVEMLNAKRIYNFDSTAVEEAVMLDIMHKFENVPSKGYNLLPELYEEEAKDKYMWNFNSSKAIANHIEKTYQ